MPLHAMVMRLILHKKSRYLDRGKVHWGADFVNMRWGVYVYTGGKIFTFLIHKVVDS